MNIAKFAEKLRKGVISSADGYDVNYSATDSLMKEGAHHLKSQASEIESLTAEVERLREALQSVANIELSGEIAWDDREGSDWQTAYDSVISIARQKLKGA